MIHYVYRITIPDGRYYIGVRSCECDPGHDPYWGSGTIIKRLLRKNASRKDILSTHETREEAAQAEADLVTPERLLDPLCVNQKTGGDHRGSMDAEARQRLSDTMKIRKLAAKLGEPITPELIARALAPKAKPPRKKRKPLTAEHRAKIAAALTGHAVTPETRAKIAAGNQGQKRTPEQRARIAAAAAGRELSRESRARHSAAQKARRARERGE